MIALGRIIALAVALATASLAHAEPQRILFIGNSFTMGANSAALRYRPDSVTDLHDDGVGGVPAIFKTFAEQAGQDWQVTHELRGGTNLHFHLTEQREKIDRPWDVVVMQQYSTLDPKKPGDAISTLEDAPALARMFVGRNPAAKVYLSATWSRADQTYRKTGHWFGRPISAMALDLRRGMDLAAAGSPDISGVVPVGQAWQRAIDEGIADANPYDGREFGKIDLWSWDQYHASAEGYYLEALTIFAKVTGYDVRQFGAGEKAAQGLGIEPKAAEALQRLAMEQIAEKD